MNDAMNTRNAQLLGMLGITAAAFGVFLYADGIGSALVIGAILLAYTALVHLGRRRSDTLEVMGGLGDERVRALYTRSVAFVGSVLAFVLPSWWLVTVALGEPNETLSLLCAIFAVLWVGAVVVLSRRG
jgi:uncharacterized membrane protein